MKPTFWLLLVLLMLPAAAPAAERTAACTPARATATTISQIAGDPDRWMGHCVTVTGVTTGSLVVEDSAAYYRDPKEIGAPSSNGGVLGLDGKRPPKWRTTQITGRVQDCEDMRQAVEASMPTGSLYLISGYCHNWSGAYLRVVAHRDRGPNRLYRAVDSQSGDLEPVPADWSHRAMADDYRDRFLKALKAGDTAALGVLHTPYVENPKEGLAAASAILAPRSIFSEIRRSTGDPQAIYLTYRGLDAEDRAREDYRVTMCFCREADCMGRWPVDGRDVKGLASHPYACTELTPWLLSPKEGEVPVMLTEWADGGPLEPSR